MYVCVYVCVYVHACVCMELLQTEQACIAAEKHNARGTMQIVFGSLSKVLLARLSMSLILVSTFSLVFST